MSLYSDIPTAKVEKPTAWVKSALVPPPRKRVATESSKAAPLVAYEAAAESGDAVLSAEYDPTKPNDYEQCLQERAKRNAMRLAEEEAEKRKRALAAYDQREGITSQDMTGEEAWRRRVILAGGNPDQVKAPEIEPDPLDADKADAKTKAEKMLMKYGWKQGKGLGKEEQGIATPLVHRKIDQTTAMVVQAEPLAVPAPKKALPPPPPKKPTKKLRGKPSEVILLRNMVAPADVDDSLLSETQEECQQKYGGVQECRIHQVKDGSVREQEAVRIFVRFGSVENAVKAAIDLDGRFFAGRQVCAAFYDQRRFDRNELAPDPSDPEMPPEIFES